jgi:hypothetical protein
MPQMFTEMDAVVGEATQGWKQRPLQAEALSSALDRGLTGWDTCHHVISPM